MRWLFKTEPSEYSWDDLVRDRKTTWSGVSNATAQMHLRAAAKGDDVIVYHTGGERCAIGIARVVRGAYPDPSGGPGSKLVVVDIAPVRPLPSPVTLDALKANPAMAGCDLLRISRLSIVPLAEAHWKAIMEPAA
jgi:predicted RNA-binding protein with PUA-like domain